MTGKKVVLDRRQDPNLLAGLIVRIGDRVSYAELRSGVLDMASALRAHGIRSGQAVAVLTPHAPETVMVQYALHLLGCRSVWIASSAPYRDRLDYLRRAELDAFVYDPSDPVPSLLVYPQLGPTDHRSVEGRMLTYSSDPLERELTVVGPLLAWLEKPPTKLVVVGEPEQLDRLGADLRVRFHGRLFIAKSLPFFLEVAQQGA